MIRRPIFILIAALLGGFLWLGGCSDDDPAPAPTPPSVSGSSYFIDEENGTVSYLTVGTSQFVVTDTPNPADYNEAIWGDVTVTSHGVIKLVATNATVATEAANLPETFYAIEWADTVIFIVAQAGSSLDPDGARLFTDFTVGLGTSGDCSTAAPGDLFNGIATPDEQFSITTETAWFDTGLVAPGGAGTADLSGDEYNLNTNWGVTADATGVQLDALSCSGNRMVSAGSASNPGEILYINNRLHVAEGSGGGGALLFRVDSTVSDPEIESTSRTYLVMAQSPNGTGTAMETYFGEATGAGAATGQVTGTLYSDPETGATAGATTNTLNVGGAGGEPKGLLTNFSDAGSPHGAAIAIKDGGKYRIMGMLGDVSGGAKNWSFVVFIEQ